MNSELILSLGYTQGFSGFVTITLGNEVRVSKNYGLIKAVNFSEMLLPKVELFDIIYIFSNLSFTVIKIGLETISKNFLSIFSTDLHPTDRGRISERMFLIEKKKSISKSKGYYAQKTLLTFLMFLRG